MPEPTNGLAYEVRELTRRIGKLEDRIDAAKLDAIEARLNNFESSLRNMSRTLVGLAVSILVGVAVALILSVGNHP